MKLVNALSLVGALAIGSVVVGCMTDSAPARQGEAQLVISAGVKDVNKTKGLGKTSVISLKKLVITLKSSDSTDAIRRDTLVASDTVGSLFTTDATDDQIVSRTFRVTPMRSWTIVTKTLDQNDSVIHYDSQLVSNLLIGETRPVTVNLASRFVMYEARFSLPDSLIFTQLDSLKQQLKVERIIMIVDGDTVIDSTTTPRFAPTPTQHSVFFDYIRVNETPDVTIEFLGTVGSDTTSGKLFTYVYDDIDPTEETPNEPDVTYTGPNANELGSYTGLTINIGKVGTVVFEPVIDPNVTTKKGVK